MSETQLHFGAFAPDLFLQWVDNLSGARDGQLRPLQEELAVPQARYLANYLGRDLGARSFVVEVPYVDRHFIEEYAGYYATTLHPPSPHAARIHFFGEDDFNAGKLRDRLVALANGAPADEVCRDLSQSYLGFVVIRPLPDTPIGRTVLRTVADGTDGPVRNFRPARVIHGAHLAGLRLQVPGVAFQQQDQGVGACATTAVWAALSTALRHLGRRGPTPLEVTQAAHRVRKANRRLPAVDGLDVDQMASAVEEFGLSPGAFSPLSADGPAVFAAALKCYLASRIPVVLHVGEDGEGHAVTAVGYSEKTDDPWELNRFSLKTPAFRRLYLHDDRLGPYARHACLLDDQKVELRLVVSEDGDEWAAHLVDGMRVWTGIAPVYPKLRMRPTGLFGVAAAWQGIVNRALPDAKLTDFAVQCRFEMSGELLRQVLALPIEEDRKVNFAETAFLSRYVGVAELYVDGQPVLWALCDATDVNRDRSPGRNTIAVIPFLEVLDEYLEETISRTPELHGVRVV